MSDGSDLTTERIDDILRASAQRIREVFTEAELEASLRYSVEARDFSAGLMALVGYPPSADAQMVLRGFIACRRAIAECEARIAALGEALAIVAFHAALRGGIEAKIAEAEKRLAVLREVQGAAAPSHEESEVH